MGLLFNTGFTLVFVFVRIETADTTLRQFESQIRAASMPTSKQVRTVYGTVYGVCVNGVPIISPSLCVGSV
jgi:hypothetical protein